MRRTLGRRAALLTGAMLCLIAHANPATAQDQSAPAESVARSPVQTVAGLDVSGFDVSGLDVLGRAGTSAAVISPERPPQLTRSAPEERSGAHSVISRDLISVNSTPFSTETSLPLCDVLGGSVQVSGFNSVSSMENVLWGLPGAGSLPAWSATSGQSHVSVSAPKPAEAYGIALRLHPEVIGHEVRATLPGQIISRILHANRG